MVVVVRHSPHQLHAPLHACPQVLARLSPIAPARPLAELRTVLALAFGLVGFGVQEVQHDFWSGNTLLLQDTPPPFVESVGKWRA